jgi:nitroimidazol reductase NimA-like FMN-containing flavoprotein (pyridoxamine 5'-phosphate oxidase superfamily)
MLGELSRQDIQEVLNRHAIGRLGCHSRGFTYVVPISYVYDGASAIYFHSLDGLKIQMMRENPHVCFEVDNAVNPADWQSVIAWGTFEELTGKAATAGLELLLRRLLPYVTGETTTPSDGIPGSAKVKKLKREVLVCRVNLVEMTGRFEKREDARTIKWKTG